MRKKMGLRPSLNFKLHFGNYVDLAALPPIPDEIDWSLALSYVDTMFANDKVGDCFWAAAAKLLMTQSANSATELHLTTADVLSAYADATGYAGTDVTDLGTEPTAGFKFLASTGIAGVKFGPALSVSPTRVDLVMAALHLGCGLMVGVQMPDAWEDALIWSAYTGPAAGGHEIVSPKGSRANGLYIETWGE